MNQEAAVDNIRTEDGSPKDADCLTECTQAVGKHGNSGHSIFRQWRFAYAAFGPLTAGFVMFFAKDMYILKYGADANRAGVISTVWSIAFPLAYLVSGHVMEESMPLFQNWNKSWGRRAPWFMTHVLPLALSVGLIFLPGVFWIPEAGSKLLEAWLVCCLIVGSWCLPVLLNAIESCRVEIYPFKEERVVIEAMTKVVGVFAAACGLAPQMVLWVNGTLPMRVVISLFLMFCISTSLEAVSILKDAKQPCGDLVPRARLWDCFKVLENLPMFHASFIRFWHSAADTTYLSMSIYYVTFVDAFDSTDRAKWGLIAGILVAAMEFMVLTPFWGYVWSSRTESLSDSQTCGRLLHFLANSMRETCFTFHVIGAFFPPLCLRILPHLGVQKPWEWIIYSIIFRFFYSPQAFFRTVSFCWAVDEDCHRLNRRREALHAGVTKFFEDEGRAIAFLVFLGLGWAGLETENCELLCKHVKPRSDCVAACDRKDILRQPEAVRDYILFAMTFLVPLFGLLCALHIWLYPLHGDRLKALQDTQASVFQAVRPPRVTPSLFGIGSEASSRTGSKDSRFSSPSSRSSGRPGPMLAWNTPPTELS